MRRSKRWGLIVGLGLALLSLSACIFGPPPGEGSKAERGYAAAAPVIEALEAYHTAQQTYPATLDELAPDYLAAIPQPEAMPPLTYELTEQSYQLAFEYVGPGMNRCVYTPEEEWDCMGFF